MIVSLELDLLRQLLDERHEQVVVLLTEVRDKVAVQNGRVARLEAQVAVLEERTPRPSAAGLAGGGIGAAIVGALAMIWEMIHK